MNQPKLVAPRCRITPVLYALLGFASILAVTLLGQQIMRLHREAREVVAGLERTEAPVYVFFSPDNADYILVAKTNCICWETRRSANDTNRPGSRPAKAGSETFS